MSSKKQNTLSDEKNPLESKREYCGICKNRVIIKRKDGRLEEIVWCSCFDFGDDDDTETLCQCDECVGRDLPW